MKNHATPPKLAKWVFKRAAQSEEQFTILGDMEEWYYDLCQREGLINAHLWYWRQVMIGIPSLIRGSIYWGIVMFKNYFKIAMRNMQKHKAYSLINILGLTIGIACCVLILLFVQDELSFDRFHENAERIYRVTRLWYNSDGAVNLHLGHVAPPIAPLMENDFPDIVQIARITSGGRPLVNHTDQYFEESGVFFAEENVFDIFTFNVIQGDPQSALSEPVAVVITDEMANKYFGTDDALGQTLHFDFRGQKVDLKVTGVVKPFPHNSHFHFNFLVSFKTYEMAVGEEEMQSWGSNNYGTYFLMPKDYDIALLARELDPFIDRHYGEGRSQRTQLKIQRLVDIHLHSHLDSEFEANSDIAYVYIFSVIAFFILIIACINFMNLATARSGSRAKEVGLRKVVGALRQQVIRQFLNESIMMAVLAMVFATLLVLLVLPLFNQFVGREISLQLFKNPLILAAFAGIALFVGMGAGSYPAFILSSFKPVKILKGGLSKTSGGRSFRTILVVAQFTISITLIIAVGIVNNQLKYMRNQKLGFDKENVVVLPSSPYIRNHLETVKNQLVRHENILNVSAAKRVPSGRLLDSSSAAVLEGEVQRSIEFRIAVLRVDHDYIPTFGMELAAGRNFSRTMATDSMEAFVINETAARRIGWSNPEDAVDKAFRYGRRRGRIIGVTKDFHFESMHQPIVPILMLISEFSLNQISIRMRPGNIPETMEFIKQKWQEFRPNYPFQYYFIDEQFDQLYESEENLRQIFSYFAFLAILIACLGLFGLASFTAEQRTKEMGIRKVLGASVTGIILLLSREFTKWILVANIIAWPLAYFAMNRWLQDFAYRIQISWFVFLISGVVALAIALLTVCYQAVKAAVANPVNSLRYE